jgi:AcrR family transcriptional regulator
MRDGSRRRGPYSTGLARRAAIVDAARERFVQNGFAGASLTDIARTAGVTDTGLKHHFKSKDELLMEVLVAAERESAGIADELLTGRASVEELWATLVRLTEHNAEAPGLVHLSVLLTADATLADHPAREYMLARHERVVTATASALQRGIEVGSVAPGTDCELVARETMAIQDGLQTQWILTSRSFDLVAAVRAYVARTAASLAPELPAGRAPVTVVHP